MAPLVARVTLESPAAVTAGPQAAAAADDILFIAYFLFWYGCTCFRDTVRRNRPTPPPPRPRSSVLTSRPTVRLRRRCRHLSLLRATRARCCHGCVLLLLGCSRLVVCVLLLANEVHKLRSFFFNESLLLIFGKEIRLILWRCMRQCKVGCS